MLLALELPGILGVGDEDSVDWKFCRGVEEVEVVEDELSRGIMRTAQRNKI